MSNGVRLSEFQSGLVLSCFPIEARVIKAEYMQELRPCPIRVDVNWRGEISAVVLRISRNPGGVSRESAAFESLAKLGLPVPTVLSQPKLDPDAPELHDMSVNTMLEGRTVQSLAPDLPAVASNLIVEAIGMMHAATSAAQADSFLNTIPRRTLQDDLSAVLSRGGDWLTQPLVADAAEVLAREISHIQAPLVFSNGDYQPANFLTDGERVTGLLDFEKAAFVDPLSVVARFPVYDLWPLSNEDLMTQALAQLGYSPRDLAARTAVFAIRTLQTKVPAFGGTKKDEEWRVHVSGVLEKSLQLVESSRLSPK